MTRRGRQPSRSRRSHREGRRHGDTLKVTRLPERENETGISNSNINLQSFLTELTKTLSTTRNVGNKFPMLGNIIPEFDPMIKGQTIHTWLCKVEECAKLYNWGDDQVIHYALPRLSGVARSWYQALPSMSYSWPEWKLKLVESFPSSDDYAELLNEMLVRRARFNESLELYYYNKINMLNRCEIYGKRAVDCLLYGIDDRSLRLGAKAAKCQEPEQVLEYFQSIQRQSYDTEKYKRPNSSLTINSKFNVNENKRVLPSNKSNASASQKCYNCQEIGHFSFNCPKKILRCNVCKKMGHITINCPKLQNDNKDNKDSVTEKSILHVDVEDTNDKYNLNL